MKKKLNEYDVIINNSKTEAKNYFKQTREKILKDISLKKESLDKEISEEINKAEAEIKNLMEKAPDRVNKIAIETSAELVRQLIGADVNNSSISAIVEDLSTRNRRKYYGN